MEAVLLDEKLVERLQSFSGETVQDKIIYLARETIAAKLKECNERILDYEFRCARLLTTLTRLGIETGFLTSTRIRWKAISSNGKRWRWKNNTGFPCVEPALEQILAEVAEVIALLIERR